MLSHVICPVLTHLGSPTGWTRCPGQGLGAQEPRLKTGQHLEPSGSGGCERARNVPGVGRLGAEGQSCVRRASHATWAGAQELLAHEGAVSVQERSLLGV